MDKYKYLLLFENDNQHGADGSTCIMLHKNQIYEIEKTLQMNPQLKRYFIKLKNGEGVWLWEKEADVEPDFKLLTLGDLRNLKINKLNGASI